MRVIPSSVCTSHAGKNSLSIRQFFILLGTPFSLHQHPPRLRGAHQTPLICVCIHSFSIYRCVTVELVFLWAFVVSILGLVWLIYLMDLYFSRQPTFENRYGCITSELNVIALTGSADKPVPTAFPSQTGHLDARPFGNSKFLMLLLPQIHFWLSAPYNACSLVALLRSGVFLASYRPWMHQEIAPPPILPLLLGISIVVSSCVIYPWSWKPRLSVFPLEG